MLYWMNVEGKIKREERDRFKGASYMLIDAV